MFLTKNYNENVENLLRVLYLYVEK